MEKAAVQAETMKGYLAIVDEIAGKYVDAPGSVIPVLQQTQARIGYLPIGVIERIGHSLGVPPSRVYGVASFYSQFRFNPVGKYIIKVCVGTACHVQGAGAITDAICDELGVHDGGTTEDGMFTVDSVSCIGCCSLAPVIMIGDDTFGRLTPAEARKVVREYGK